jgi:hypothetical protein
MNSSVSDILYQSKLGLKTRLITRRKIRHKKAGKRSFHLDVNIVTYFLRKLRRAIMNNGNQATLPPLLLELASGFVGSGVTGSGVTGSGVKPATGVNTILRR